MYRSGSGGVNHCIPNQARNALYYLKCQEEEDKEKTQINPKESLEKIRAYENNTLLPKLNFNNYDRVQKFLKEKKRKDKI